MIRTPSRFLYNSICYRYPLNTKRLFSTFISTSQIKHPKSFLSMSDLTFQHKIKISHAIVVPRFSFVRYTSQSPKASANKPLTGAEIAIKYSKVMCIDSKGVSLGEIPIKDALEKSLLVPDHILTLVQARDPKPPICRILPIKDESEPTEQKKVKRFNGSNLRDKFKMVQFSDNISEHDLQTKVSIIIKLLAERYPVKLMMRLRRHEEVDPVFLSAIFENIVSRLTDFSTKEGDIAISDGKAFVTLKPKPLSVFVKFGLAQSPDEKAARKEAENLKKAAKLEKARQISSDYNQKLALGLVQQKQKIYTTPAGLEEERQSKLNRHIQREDPENFGDDETFDSDSSH